MRRPQNILNLIAMVVLPIIALSDLIDWRRRGSARALEIATKASSGWARFMPAVSRPR